MADDWFWGIPKDPPKVEPKCKCGHAWCPINDLMMFSEETYDENGKFTGWRNGLPNWHRLFKIHVAYLKKEELEAKIRAQKKEQQARKEKWLASKKNQG